MGTVNVKDVALSETRREETHFKRKQLSDHTDSEELGCSLYELPPGSKSWPFHYHTGNEEAIFVLDGNGIIRLPDEQIELKEGDYLGLPSGDDHAHRVINNTERSLRYLVISTMSHPEVLIYPDSNKVGVMTGSAPGDHEGRTLTKFFPDDSSTSYWDGEK